MRSGLLLGGGALVVASLLSTSGAEAQVRRAGHGGVDFQFRLDFVAQHLRTLPSVKDVSLDNLGSEGTLSTGHSSTQLGMGSGLDIVVSDRYVLPLMAFNVMFATGSYPTVYVASGDHVSRLEPWQAVQAEVLVLGLGMRWKHRRWMGGFLVQPGAAITFLTAQRSNEDEHRVQAGVHGMVRATVEVCRRLDPEQRACLFGGPNVILDGWFNGGVAGVRMEYGP